MVGGVWDSNHPVDGMKNFKILVTNWVLRTIQVTDAGVLVASAERGSGPPPGRLLWEGEVGGCAGWAGHPLIYVILQVLETSIIISHRDKDIRRSGIHVGLG